MLLPAAEGAPPPVKTATVGGAAREASGGNGAEEAVDGARPSFKQEATLVASAEAAGAGASVCGGRRDVRSAFAEIKTACPPLAVAVAKGVAEEETPPDALVGRAQSTLCISCCTCL